MSDDKSYIYRYGIAEGNLSDLCGQLTMLNQDIEQFRRRGAPPAIMNAMTARIGALETAIAGARAAQAQKRQSRSPAVASAATPLPGRRRAGEA